MIFDRTGLSQIKILAFDVGLNFDDFAHLEVLSNLNTLRTVRVEQCIL